LATFWFVLPRFGFADRSNFFSVEIPGACFSDHRLPDFAKESSFLISLHFQGGAIMPFKVGVLGVSCLNL